MQLVAVRVMVKMELGRAERNSGDVEAWSEDGGIYQVGHTPEAIVINNAAKILKALGSAMR